MDATIVPSIDVVPLVCQAVTTLQEVENILVECAGYHLEVVCHAMRQVQLRFLHPNSQYNTLVEYVDARQKALGLSFAGLSAPLYALGSDVYHDLRKFDFRPTTIAQVRVLTKLDGAGRVAVWQNALQQTEGHPRTKITRGVLEATAESLNAGLRRAAPGDREEARLPTCESTLALFTSAETDRWGTTRNILVPSRRVLRGRISLDPFSEPAFNKRVRAERIFTRAQNGYRQDWFGTVFLNAPGGMVNGESAMGMALRKAIHEYKAGRVEACLCLLKAAVGYQWFELVYAHPLCFLSARPKFHQPSGRVLNESPHGYVMVYLGREKAAFHKEFSRLGQVYMPA